MATQEQWEAFGADYQLKMQDVRQTISDIINDPNATIAEKQAALEDLGKQVVFGNFLSNQIAEMQDTGTVPATVTVSGGGVSGLYTRNGEYRSVTKLDIPYPQGFMENATINFMCVIADDYTFSVATDPAGTIQVFGGTSSPRFRFYLGNPSINGTMTYTGTGILVTLSVSVTWGSEFNFWYYISEYDDIPDYSAQNYSADYFFAHTLLGAYGVDVSLDSDTVENPWDYYNDTLLPDLDPSRAAYPNGYSPIPPKPEPDLPPDIDTEIEHDGDDIEINNPVGIGGGFGFITMYAISGAQIAELGRKLWNGFSDIQDYLQNFEYNVNAASGSMNFADIMEFFISLKVYPFPLGNLTTVSAAGNDFYFGSGAAPIPFASNLHTIDEYIGILDCGSLSIPYWFGDYRDYDLDISLILPYCGTAILNPSDVMGGTLTCTYYIDFCTGACLAVVMCDTWEGKTIEVASMAGQLGADIPLTATNSNGIMSRLYGDRLDIASLWVNTAKNAATGITSTLAGNVSGAVGALFNTFLGTPLREEELKNQQASRGATACPMLSSGRGLSAFGNPTAVYVQMRTPKYAVPENYGSTVGDPATKQVTIGDCDGFCKFINVDTSGIATDTAIQAQIKQALESGIYIN